VAISAILSTLLTTLDQTGEFGAILLDAPPAGILDPDRTPALYLEPPTWTATSLSPDAERIDWRIPLVLAVRVQDAADRFSTLARLITLVGTMCDLLSAGATLSPLTLARSGQYLPVRSPEGRVRIWIETTEILDLSPTPGHGTRAEVPGSSAPTVQPDPAIDARPADTGGPSDLGDRGPSAERDQAPEPPTH
jgi:hypothetical protein